MARYQAQPSRVVPLYRWSPPITEIALGLLQGGRIPSGISFRELGVSAIVDLDDEPHYMPPTPAGCVYVYWPVVDGSRVDSNTTRALSHCVRDLMNAGHVVLVHCSAGLNRSSLITARTLIAIGWSPKEAIEHIRKRRRDPRALSNRWFESWLEREEPGT